MSFLISNNNLWHFMGWSTNFNLPSDQIHINWYYFFRSFWLTIQILSLKFSVIQKQYFAKHPSCHILLYYLLCPLLRQEKLNHFMVLAIYPEKVEIIEEVQKMSTLTGDLIVRVHSFLQFHNSSSFVNTTQMILTDKDYWIIQKKKFSRS